MKKNDFYYSLFSSIALLTVIFAILIICVIYPIYFLSSFSPTIYSIVCLFLFLGFVFFLVARKITYLIQKWGFKTTTIAIFNYLSPFLLACIIVFIELFAYRLSFVINWYLFLCMELFLQLAIIVLTVNWFQKRSFIQKKLFCKN